MSSPSERLAFSLDETSIDPSARSSITPTQSLDSIVRGRALSDLGALQPEALLCAACARGEPSPTEALRCWRTSGLYRGCPLWPPGSRSALRLGLTPKQRSCGHSSEPESDLELRGAEA